MLWEPVLEFTTSGNVVRLAGPGRASVYWASGRWMPLAPDMLHTMFGDDRLVDAVGLLCPRNNVAAAKTVDVAAVTGMVSEIAPHIGWPRELPAAPTVQDLIDRRSNDYWLIDAARDALGEAVLDGVSVVIPARNSQETIDQVLDAIASAAGSVPWECVVVDDASDVPLRVRTFDRRVRVVRSEERLFCGGARNFGLPHVRHDVVLFCDSDTLLPPDFFAEHLPLHQITPNLITVSMRDTEDLRVSTLFTPEWNGLKTVHEPVLVRSLAETDNWRSYGYGRRLGPVGLPYVVWGHNICVSTEMATAIRFPSDYVGWGLEDNSFAALCIARGCFVRPVLETPVHHLPHPPRSGSEQQQERELVANLARYDRDLHAPVNAPWLRNGVVVQ